MLYDLRNTFLSYGCLKVDRYSFQIVEKGTLVKEEIQIDLENQKQVVRVPKHNDVDAMDLLNDFNAVSHYRL